MITSVPVSTVIGRSVSPTLVSITIVPADVVYRATAASPVAEAVADIGVPLPVISAVPASTVPKVAPRVNSQSRVVPPVVRICSLPALPIRETTALAKSVLRAREVVTSRVMG